MELSVLNPLAPPFSSNPNYMKGRDLTPDVDGIRTTIHSDFLNLIKGDTEGTAIANLVDMYTYFLHHHSDPQV